MKNNFKSASALLFGIVVAGFATLVLLSNKHQGKFASLNEKIRKLKKERELKRGNISDISDCFI